MGRAPLLAKPKDREKLIIYLGVSQHALSVALIRGDEGVQCPIYYVSKSLIDTETRYTPMEKLAYYLVMASKKLHLIFRLIRLKS